jgi:hypothetical protein
VAKAGAAADKAAVATGRRGAGVGDIAGAGFCCGEWLSSTVIFDAPQIDRPAGASKILDAIAVHV